jgi:hypothetical protein
MKNIFLTGMQDVCQHIVTSLYDDVTITNNLEQVLAMVKLNEVDRVCIYVDAWNCSGMPFNQIRAQGAAERIHQINPDILILIWDGRTYDPPEFADIPPSLQCSGELSPIKNVNEIYLSFENYNSIEITKKFFDKTLTEEDIIERDCIAFKL